MSQLIAYVDGGSNGSPGPSGIGVLIEKPDGEMIRIARWIGHHDNNVAEYAALLDAACTSTTGNPNNCDGANGNVNDTAVTQSTANSALGINGAGPSPNEGIDSFYGPWTQEVDLGVARSFTLAERHVITFQAQVFNIANHPNYYVQNGNGVNQVQYLPTGSTCGNGIEITPSRPSASDGATKRSRPFGFLRSAQATVRT